MKKIVLALALGALAACVEPQTENPQSADRVIDSSFVQSALTTRDRRINYAVHIFEENGFYGVCAAANSITRFEDRQALGALDVTVNGRKLADGIGWGNQYREDQDLTGRLASCRLSNVRVVADPAFDIKLTRNGF